jgi:hypothetical protein
MQDGIPARLARGEAEASERLDQERQKLDERPVVKVDLHLRDREIETGAELDALLKELKARLAPMVEKNQRVRLV